MKIAALYLGMAVVGYIAAIPLRKNNINTDFIGKLFAIVVTSLIGLMGFRIGSNEDTVANIGEIGLASLAMAVISLAVCIAMNRALKKLLKMEDERTEKKEKKKTVIPKSTKRYILVVLIGFLVGYILVIKTMKLDYDTANEVTGTIVGYLLYLLVFSVGMDFGAADAIHDIAGKVNLSILAIPVVTAVGTIASILVCSLVFPFNAKEAICIAATFGWYSMGPNIMIDAGMVTAAAYAFLTNFLRDMISLITIPIIAERVGYMETVCMPQAASMDLCIATIEEATDKNTTFMAFVSGAIFTAIIPIIMPVLTNM